RGRVVRPKLNEEGAPIAFRRGAPLYPITGRLDPLEDFLNTWVCCGGSIWEDQRRYGLVPSVDGFHQLRGAFDFFDVDLGVADSLGIHEALEVAAIAAPRGGEHRDCAGLGDVGGNFFIFAHT